jgi:hypothetical protein
VKLRVLLALVTLTAGIGVAGWAMTRPADLPEEEVTGLNPADVAVEQVVASAVSSGAQNETLPNANPNARWDSVLLSPYAMTTPPPPQPPVVARTEATAMPVPAPRRERVEPRVAPPVAKREKPRHDTFDGKLSVGQVADIKRRLRLTADQEEHWKPVEKMLLELAKKQVRSGNRITLTAVESQNLYWAAGPLVMRLREDQKQEARNLARAMGLETVAALL